MCDVLLLFDYINFDVAILLKQMTFVIEGGGDCPETPQRIKMKKK